MAPMAAPGLQPPGAALSHSSKLSINTQPLRPPRLTERQQLALALRESQRSAAAAGYVDPDSSDDSSDDSDAESEDAYSSAQDGQRQRTVRRSSRSGRARQTGKGAKRATGPQSPLKSDAPNSDSLDSTAIHGLPHQTPTTSENCSPSFVKAEPGRRQGGDEAMPDALGAAGDSPGPSDSDCEASEQVVPGKGSLQQRHRKRFRHSSGSSNDSVGPAMPPGSPPHPLVCKREADDMATPAAQRPPKRHRLRPQSASQPDSGGLDAAVIAQMARRRQEKYGGCCPAAKHCAQRGGPQTVPQASPPSAHQTPQQRKQPSHRPVHTVVLQDVDLFAEAASPSTQAGSSVRLRIRLPAKQHAASGARPSQPPLASPRSARTAVVSPSARTAPAPQPSPRAHHPASATPTAATPTASPAAVATSAPASPVAMDVSTPAAAPPTHDAKAVRADTASPPPTPLANTPPPPLASQLTPEPADSAPAPTAAHPVPAASAAVVEPAQDTAAANPLPFGSPAVVLRPSAPLFTLASPTLDDLSSSNPDCTVSLQPQSAPADCTPAASADVQKSAVARPDTNATAADATATGIACPAVSPAAAVALDAQPSSPPRRRLRIKPLSDKRPAALQLDDSGDPLGPPLVISRARRSRALQRTPSSRAWADAQVPLLRADSSATESPGRTPARRLRSQATLESGASCALGSGSWGSHLSLDTLPRARTGRYKAGALAAACTRLRADPPPAGVAPLQSSHESIGALLPHLAASAQALQQRHDQEGWLLQRSMDGVSATASFGECSCRWARGRSCGGACAAGLASAAPTVDQGFAALRRGLRCVRFAKQSPAAARDSAMADQWDELASRQQLEATSLASLRDWLAKA